MSDRGARLKIRRLLTDNRGMAFITVLYVVFALGLMLFAFAFLSQNEARFAAYNRNSTVALALAEAGAQEAVNRLDMFGATLGTLPAGSPCPNPSGAANAFANSLAAGAPGQGAGGSVTYESALQSLPSVFPIVSCATFGGAERVVRILERMTMQAGFGRTIVGPQVAFTGNTSLVVGDSYARTTFSFVGNYTWPAGPGATATNLVSPQLLAGTTISLNGTMPGGAGLYNYTYECADGSLTEVAPTNCSADGGRAVGGSWPLQVTLPVNWHPMVPTGMSAADFNTVVQWATANPTSAQNAGVSVRQATQGGQGVTYAPAGTYTPPYWSLSGDNGKVLLVIASKPICVNTPGNQVQQATGSPPACSGGYTYYGSNVGGTNYTMRFVDWGLVQDDLTRVQAQTFFQPPTCTSCVSGGPDGYQNGIRYIPILPQINVLAQACTQNVRPGTNVFDVVGSPSGSYAPPTCTNPPVQTVHQSSVTFAGTPSAPESLVIDNGPPGGTAVQIMSNTSASCSNPNGSGWEWGTILATGDVTLVGNMAFNGFIYTPGTVTIAGNAIVTGGIYSANLQSTGSEVNETGNFTFCGGTGQTVLSPLFYQFEPVSWQDRPLDEP